MTLKSITDAALADAFRSTAQSDGVRITTHCMYPSHAYVKVFVRGGTDTFVVTDEGAALREIESAGAEVKNFDRLLRQFVTKQGLQIAKGAISSPYCKVDELVVAITMVANASRDAADWLFSHTKVKRHRNFKAMLRTLLEEKFDHLGQDTLVGKSNKPHRFEHLISLPDGKRIVVDPVFHDPGSINARVIANLDVKMAGYPNLEQQMIYDDQEAWEPQDLNLLQVGAAVVIPFSKAQDVFDRLVGRERHS
jgi:hypothetical protein